MLIVCIIWDLVHTLPWMADATIERRANAESRYKQHVRSTCPVYPDYTFSSSVLQQAPP